LAGFLLSGAFFKMGPLEYHRRMNGSFRAQSRPGPPPQPNGSRWWPGCPPWRPSPGPFDPVAKARDGKCTHRGYRNIATGKTLLEKTRFSQLAVQDKE
jgi:hypothetical protein